MKIEQIELYHISQKLVAPFTTSFGSQEQRDCLIIALRSEGLTAWGECVATNDPGYSYETVYTAWHILEDFLIPAVLGQEVAEPDDVMWLMRWVRGHPLAKAGLEQAVWDLLAQAEGVSFAEKLAAPYPAGTRPRVQVGISLGIQPSLEQTFARIQAAIEKGYTRVKLKIKPGHDADFARQVRAKFPDLLIMVDANSAFTLDDVAVFQAMDDLDLLMIEQPLGYEDIYDHSHLRPQIASPLCLDESIHSADHARYALALGACDIINIKPSRVGGWAEARKIHDLCVPAGVQVWCGGMLETGIGRAGQLALASLPGFTLPGDISATERYYEQDIATHFYLNAEDSTITVPTRPGLGVDVDRKELNRVTLRQKTF